jgi:hypothetical protein
MRNRHERAAHHQTLSRRANEGILAIPNRPPANFELFICECCLDGCTETVGLTVDEYESVRRHPARFVVVPGHVDPRVERVVDAASDRYEVVQKVESAPRRPGV